MTRDGLVPGEVGSKIYEAADQGLIPAEVAPEMIRAFLRAGMDSTIGGISGALRYLALDPKQWDALRADPGKARAAFDEATHPDVFDLDRNTMGHMGFGDGLHVCIGLNIARMEGEVILATMAKRFKRIKLNGKPTYKTANALHALKSLPLRLVPA